MRGTADALIASELSQVWFVRDFLQLIFEEADSSASPSLQCWVWPLVRTPAREFRSDGSGYRDALCDLIGATVTRAKADVGLTVEFGERSLLIAPLPEEVTGPEIAMLHTLGAVGDNTVWRVGEGAFAYLE